MPTINAREARELVESSTKVLTSRVEYICDKIREEATLGSSELVLKSYLHQNAKWMEIEKKPFYAPEFTAVQKQVEKELKRLGFSVDLHTYTIQIGGGFKSMDDEVREENAFAMRVRW